MSKLKNNYKMAEAWRFVKKGKVMLYVLGAVIAVFPFIPPYFLYYDQLMLGGFVFDPRNPEQVPYFFGYLAVYYFITLIFLSKYADKLSRLRKEIAEKAILLGCPMEIKSRGASASNSYSTTVMVNEKMMEKLLQLNVNEKPKWQEEEVAMAEPFVEKMNIGSATSAKFLAKNIPYFEKARKIGTVPEIPSDEVK